MVSKALSRNWRVLVLRGLVALVFGVAALAWPTLTSATLAVLFGAYAFADGVLGVVTARLGRQTDERTAVLLLEGAVSTAAGVVALTWPAMPALALVYLIAARFVVTGILQIMCARDVRRQIEDEWVLISSGFASLAFGALTVFSPGDGASTRIAIAFYVMILGAIMVGCGFHLRGWPTGIQQRAPRRA